MARNIEVVLELDNKQYNQAIKQSQKNTKDFEKGSVDSANAVRNAFIALGGAAVLKSIVDVGAEFQGLRNSLNVVFGSVDAGTAAFDRVNTFAQSTQFSVQTLTQAFVQLKGAGVEPTEELLMTFADTASVTTDQMGTFQAALDLVSRSTAGGLGLEDLNRLADRGIPVFTILQEKLGLARLEISEFGKTAEGADIIISALLEGLQEDVGGALTNRLQDIEIVTSNLGIAFDNLKNALFETFGDTASVAIQGLTDAVNRLADNTEAINSLAKVFAGLVTVILSFGAVRGITALMNVFEKRLFSLFTRMGDGRTKTKGLADAFRGLFLQSKGSKFDDVTKGLNGTNRAVAETSKRVFTFTGGLATLSRTLLRFAGIAGIAFTVFEAGKLIFSLFKEEQEEVAEATEEVTEKTKVNTEALIEQNRQRELAIIAEEAFQKGLRGTTKAIQEQTSAFDKNDPLFEYQEFLSKIIGESNALAVEQVFAGRALQFLNDLFDKGGIALRTYEIAVERLNGILGIQNEELTEGEKAFESFNDRIGLGAVTITEYLELQRQLQALIEKYPELFEEAAKATDNLDDALKENEGIASFLQTLGRAQKALSQDLATALVEGKSASEAFQQFFKKLVVQLIADALRLAVIQPILGSLFGISFGAGGAISGLTGGGLFGFLGGRADGGPVMRNKPYIVGERGPELFVPGAAGTIVPNEALSMGGGTTVNYNIQAVDAQSFQALVARDPEFIFAVTEAGRRRLPQ